MLNTSSCFGVSVTTNFLTSFPRSLTATGAARSDTISKFGNRIDRVTKLAGAWCCTFKQPAVGSYCVGRKMSGGPRRIRPRLPRISESPLLIFRFPRHKQLRSSSHSYGKTNDGRGTNYRVNVRDLDQVGSKAA